MNKICSHCKHIKELSEFNKGTGKYGLINWCKACCKLYWQTNERKAFQNKRRKTKKYLIFIKKYRKSLKGIYSYLKGSAKARNINFNISESVFIKWYTTQKRLCVYCKRTEKESIKDRQGKIYRLTIDRKDNNKGYILKNLALCCHKCNEIKSNIFTYEEMISIGNILKLIYRKRING
jgi:hypothetical protein